MLIYLFTFLEKNNGERKDYYPNEELSIHIKTLYYNSFTLIFYNIICT